jgi:hypothetical protein
MLPLSWFRFRAKYCKLVRFPVPWDGTGQLVIFQWIWSVSWQIPTLGRMLRSAVDKDTSCQIGKVAQIGGCAVSGWNKNQVVKLARFPFPADAAVS